MSRPTSATGHRTYSAWPPSKPPAKCEQSEKPANGERYQIFEVEDDARNLEAGNDTVALHSLNLASDPIDDAHPFMSEDLTLLQLRNLLVIRMKIAITDGRTHCFADHVLGLSDGRHRDLHISHVHVRIPSKCKHGFILTGLQLVGSDGGPVTELLFGLVGEKGYS